MWVVGGDKVKVLAFDFLRCCHCAMATLFDLGVVVDIALCL